MKRRVSGDRARPGPTGDDQHELQRLSALLLDGGEERVGERDGDALERALGSRQLGLLAVGARVVERAATVVALREARQRLRLCLVRVTAVGEAVPAEERRDRLELAIGYRQRQHIIESVFGNTKHDRGITRFHRRGRGAVRTEWRLTMATHNLLKLHKHHLATAAA
jgi:hypothetical protein